MRLTNLDDRPVKHRRGARVLVVAGDEVLLVRDMDPGVPGSRWWVLPGGGLDAGEDAATGAARELAEETGLAVDTVGGVIAERVVTHGYSDRILVQHEHFFRVDIERFDPEATALSASEQHRAVKARWVAITDLAAMMVWPVAMSELLAATPDRPLAWGEVEESTIPVK